MPPAAQPVELPEEYTPTARDLPVIGSGRTDTLIDQPGRDHLPEATLDPDATEGMGPLYVVGDVHGYYDELREALASEGLVDADGSWAAGNARLWFLGDFTDRGPDGIGVIDLVMQLSAEAAAAGGYCKALMGNHELLLLGAKRFGDTPVQSGAGTASFQAAWLLNGGQKSDMDRLEDHHLQWMARLDAVMEEDGHLLVHSDTTAYLEYGDSIEAVNDTVHDVLTRSDADEVWDLFRKFTKRFAFRDETGSQAVRELLDAYGGTRVVHGHSPIPYLLGEVGGGGGRERRCRRRRPACLRRRPRHRHGRWRHDGRKTAGRSTSAGRLSVIRAGLRRAEGRSAARRPGRDPVMDWLNFRKLPVTPCRRRSTIGLSVAGSPPFPPTARPRRPVRPYGASGDAHEQRSAPAE